MSDRSRIPARVLELLASVTGHGLSLHAASAAAGSVALDPEDWLQSTARALSRGDHQRGLADC